VRNAAAKSKNGRKHPAFQNPRVTVDKWFAI